MEEYENPPRQEETARGEALPVPDALNVEGQVKGPEAQVNEVRQFLRMFGRREPTLAFKGDKGLICRRYASAKQAAKGAEWFNHRGFECYYVGNSHRVPSDEKNRIRKPKKSDIELCVGCWLDIDNVGSDPDIVDELIHRLDWSPHHVVATGGGLQAHWRFEEPTNDIGDAEAVNRWLLDEFGDIPGLDRSCFTGEHLWRLPGTINHKRGRRSVLIHQLTDARMPLNEAGRITRNASAGGVLEATSIDWIEFEDVGGGWGDFNLTGWALINELLPRAPLWGDGIDRSAHVYRFLRHCFQELGTHKEAQEIALAVLTAQTDNPGFVSHHSFFARAGSGFKPRSDPEREALRQIDRWLSKESIDA